MLYTVFASLLIKFSITSVFVFSLTFLGLKNAQGIIYNLQVSENLCHIDCEKYEFLISIFRLFAAVSGVCCTILCASIFALVLSALGVLRELQYALCLRKVQYSRQGEHKLKVDLSLRVCVCRPPQALIKLLCEGVCFLRGNVCEDGG